MTIAQTDTSPEKSKLAGSPPGRVCFSMVIFPSLVLVKTQVTVSPGSTLKVAVLPAPEELASSQLISVGSQDVLYIHDAGVNPALLDTGATDWLLE